jgi:hypothetical protein
MSGTETAKLSFPRSLAADYSSGHPPPPHCASPQAPGAGAPQTGNWFAPAVCAAGTLNNFSSFVLPQWGHWAVSSPRISTSNSLRHFGHAYSYKGIARVSDAVFGNKLFHKTYFSVEGRNKSRGGCADFSCCQTWVIFYGCNDYSTDTREVRLRSFRLFPVRNCEGPS